MPQYMLYVIQELEKMPPTTLFIITIFFSAILIHCIIQSLVDPKALANVNEYEAWERAKKKRDERWMARPEVDIMMYNTLRKMNNKD